MALITTPFFLLGDGACVAAYSGAVCFRSTPLLFCLQAGLSLVWGRDLFVILPVCTVQVACIFWYINHVWHHLEIEEQLASAAQDFHL